MGLGLGRRYKLRNVIRRWKQEERCSQRGQYIDERGYARLKGTNQLVHRHVAEKYIVNRKLLPNEDVHHKNRNKLDNRIENLEVIDHRTHMTNHLIHKIFTGRR